ncbi:F-box/kelch-repeat protein At3g06240-like [Apium graveolens]|uniref:F-box/kelch-repeat protein At3g06240-like n=1 Tax=Apium graveolens TaxID=4045 RepID=UPI003D7901F7
MAKKMKRQKTTAADLPDEILRREILTRLPIKSVVRFKSVSKLWLSLFSDPQFVKQHHTNLSTQNPNDYDNLIVDKGTKLVILSRYEETKLLPIDKTFFLIGSVNGLVCLRRGRKFSLWNPAIHKSKEFTLPPHSSGDNGYNVGLGFDGVSNNFKVVVFGADLMSAIVYCSGLDSWTDVSIPDNVFSNFGFEESRQIAIVDGCPYWSLSRYTYETRFLMSATLCAVKFDVETYLFSVTPEFYFDATQIGGGFEFGYQFVDIKDSLNLIVYNRYSTDCVVFMYTLDGEEGCGVWSKICILGPFQFDTQGWYLSMSQGFKYVGEILYHENGFFSCLDLETEEIKRLHGTNFTNYDISCFRYEPTLFYVQGMKSVHLTTQTRTHGGYKNPRRLISSLRDQSFS